MLSVLSNLQSLSAARRRRTETLVFYLHYRVTFLLLMCACALITTSQFVTSRIKCQGNPSTDLSTDLLDSYCWSTSTYSVSTAYLKEAGVQTPHPGIGPSQNKSHHIYRNYYQYVNIVLFIQALLFYFPHLVWKSVDRDHMSFYDAVQNHIHQKDSHDHPPFESAAAYIEERWGRHTEYAIKYFLSEVLSLGNLLLQCYFLDVFLHGEFVGLGYFYTAYYHGDRLNDPITLFPLVTSCQFRRFGASGYVDVVDAMCVLPLNALNVKIFLFAWVWFSVLLGLSVLSLLHMALAFAVPKYRLLVCWFGGVLTRRREGDGCYAKVLADGNLGDWFLLRGLKGDMDPVDFSKLMEALWAKLIEEEVEIEVKEQ